jgi:predicted O-methyltransferase YrrM
MERLALVESIPGWLRPEDADKLWELAHSTPGPILEIGTYHGKSAVLMALARRDAGGDAILYTLDVDLAVLSAAKAEAESRGIAERIVFVRGTSTAFARAYPHLRPALTFIDGDHSRAAVERDLAVLQTLVPEGGQLLFHDFHDPLNEDPRCDEVKVRPAVEGSWVARDCDFDGVFGCCGLFTRRAGELSSRAVVVDLLRLDSARDQYLHRLRYPAGRVWRRIRRGNQAD